jgi:hypothetical protein
MSFEKLALIQKLSLLEKLDTEKEFEVWTQLFSEVDELEAAHYYEITKGRLGMIREFQNIVPGSKEKIIQKYLFEHLELLHPSWERASTNEAVETTVIKAFKKGDYILV